MNHWETWRPCPANFPNVSWKEILQEIRCLMHNAVARRYLFLLVYLALSWSWKNRSELEIHAERLEENDSCDDGMSLTLEEKLHKRPLTAVLHLLLLYCVLKFPDLFSTMPWTSSFLYATHCGKNLILVQFVKIVQKFKFFTNMNFNFSKIKILQKWTKLEGLPQCVVN